MEVGRVRSGTIGWLGLLTLSAACAAHPTPSAPAPKQEAVADTATPGRAAIQVEIDNRNYSDMDVYLISNGTRLLLGSAPGLAKTTLALPQGWVGARPQVRLLADPVGGDLPIRTPALVVAPGQNVYWTIGSDPASSSASAG
jgi:hypothetical protein